MALGYIILRSPYTPYSVYLRGTTGSSASGAEGQASTFRASIEVLSNMEVLFWSGVPHLSYSLNSLKGVI